MTLDPLFTPWYGAILIFLIRIVDVSCDTMRVIFAIRGKRGVAALLGFIQAFVWIFAVGAAIKHLDSIWHILGYAGGYATGTYVGVTIERAIAYGVATVRVVSKHAGVEIAEALREHGYGVTEFHGFGRDGAVEIMNSVVHRSHLDDVLAVVEKWDPDAFVTVEEPKVLRGGSLATRDYRVGGSLTRWMFGRQRA
jgi:uncharacterized protein YebE (UPF0316 family)